MHQKLKTIEVNTQPWNVIKYNLKLNIGGFNVDVGNPIRNERSLPSYSTLNLIHQGCQARLSLQMANQTRSSSTSERSIEQCDMSDNIKTPSPMKRNTPSKQILQSTLESPSYSPTVSLASPSYSPTVSLPDSIDSEREDCSDEPTALSNRKEQINQTGEYRVFSTPMRTHKHQSTSESSDEENGEMLPISITRMKNYPKSTSSNGDDEMLPKPAPHHRMKNHSMPGSSDEEDMSEPAPKRRSNHHSTRKSGDENNNILLKQLSAAKPPIIRFINSSSGVFTEEPQSYKVTHSQQQLKVKRKTQIDSLSQ